MLDNETRLKLLAARKRMKGKTNLVATMGPGARRRMKSLDAATRKEWLEKAARTRAAKKQERT